MDSSGASNSNNPSPPPPTSRPPSDTPASRTVDQLLQSGQISNAVEFYNYFRNKSSSGLSQMMTGSAAASSSSPSTSYQANKRTKKTKNTLSDYANILQQSTNEYRKGKNKPPGHIHPSASSLTLYSSTQAGVKGGTGSRPFSVYADLTRSPSSSSIYNQYLIGESAGGTVVSSSQLESGEKVEENETSGQKDDTEPSRATLSAIFFNSNSYYHKYKLRQQQQLQQQQQKTATVKDDESADELELERRREDAVNRIIRNERIKQIRMKIYECELLKEYQQNFTTAEPIIDTGASAPLSSGLLTGRSRGGKTRPGKIHSYFSRTYGPSEYGKQPATMFDEYKKASPTNTSGASGDDDAESSLEMLNNEEESAGDDDGESGIEDDENSSTSSFFQAYSTSRVKSNRSKPSSKLIYVSGPKLFKSINTGIYHSTA